MTLVESVFKRSKQQRETLAFADIAKETSVALPEVEHLVMKALSLGLIKGSIDEASAIVKVTWVQPRILSKDQIKSICDRISEWSAKVDQRVVSLEKEDMTVFAQ